MIKSKEKNNKLRNIFFPTNVEIEEKMMQMVKLKEKLLADRNKNIKLIKKDNNLFCAEPFGSFIGDCESCSHYCDLCEGFVTGGYCTVHNVSCGYGFTCRDNDSKHNKGWDEFENMKNKDIKDILNA